MKVNGEEHFEFLHHNIWADDMNEDKLEYKKFGKIGLNNCVGLSHSNILQMAHEWAQFCMKKIECYTTRNVVSHMKNWSILSQSHLGGSI
jgi:hypothetical protein